MINASTAGGYRGRLIIQMALDLLLTNLSDLGYFLRAQVPGPGAAGMEAAAGGWVDGRGHFAS